MITCRLLAFAAYHQSVDPESTGCMLLRKFSVSIFGTSASGLARRDSDLDLLLDLDGRGHDDKHRSENG